MSHREVEQDSGVGGGRNGIGRGGAEGGVGHRLVQQNTIGHAVDTKIQLSRGWSHHGQQQQEQQHWQSRHRERGREERPVVDLVDCDWARGRTEVCDWRGKGRKEVIRWVKKRNNLRCKLKPKPNHPDHPSKFLIGWVDSSRGA